MTCFTYVGTFPLPINDCSCPIASLVVTVDDDFVSAVIDERQPGEFDDVFVRFFAIAS